MGSLSQTVAVRHDRLLCQLEGRVDTDGALNDQCDSRVAESALPDRAWSGPVRLQGNRGKRCGIQAVRWRDSFVSAARNPPPSRAGARPIFARRSVSCSASSEGAMVSHVKTTKHAEADARDGQAANGRIGYSNCPNTPRRIDLGYVGVCQHVARGQADPHRRGSCWRQLPDLGARDRVDVECVGHEKQS
jgi:hypothetical protein